ncbi:MAG: hypothetical protein NT007_01270 [Candidatus Kapabacteria bacterium]|nr:hypothetical protein [Candidatus Kapabacteria bacterium]
MSLFRRWLFLFLAVFCEIAGLVYQNKDGLWKSYSACYGCGCENISFSWVLTKRLNKMDWWLDMEDFFFGGEKLEWLLEQTSFH